MTKSVSMRRIIRKNLLKIMNDEQLFEGFNNGNKLPKMNYKIVNLSNDNDRDDLELEINIWHKDSLSADVIADQTENKLNFLKINEDGCHCVFYLSFRKAVEDADPKIERRMLTYKIENYYKEEEEEE